MSISLFSDTETSFHREKFDIDLGLYPDNTPVVNFDAAWSGAKGRFRAILIRPNSMQEFFTGMMIVDSIRERGGNVRSLILPCIPGQRQDRMKWEGDMLMTAKFVAKTINAMNFERVVALDPHSLATEVLIDRLIVPNLDVAHNLGTKTTYDAVIAPDAGAAKRAEAAAKTLKVPVITASKRRDPETNKLSGFAVSGLQRKNHYLVRDDLCDAGGTFLGLAESIAAVGATADLFVTHGLFSKGTEGLAKAYGKVYATDSIDRPQERVNYIKVSEGMVIYA